MAGLEVSTEAQPEGDRGNGLGITAARTPSISQDMSRAWALDQRRVPLPHVDEVEGDALLRKSTLAGKRSENE